MGKLLEKTLSFGADCHCKKLCMKDVPRPLQSKLRTTYQTAGSYLCQASYLARFMINKPVKTSKPNSMKPRNVTTQYILRDESGEEFKVCREAFANIFGISKKKISTIRGKIEEDELEDKRGKHPNVGRKRKKCRILGNESHKEAVKIKMGVTKNKRDNTATEVQLSNNQKMPETVEISGLKQVISDKKSTPPITKKKILIKEGENHNYEGGHVIKKKKQKHREADDQFSDTLLSPERTRKETKRKQNEVLDELTIDENSESPRRKMKKHKIMEIEKNVESVEGLCLEEEILEENLTSPVKKKVKKKLVIDEEEFQNLDQTHYARKKNKSRNPEDQLSGTAPMTEKNRKKTKDKKNEVLDELAIDENSEMPQREKEKRKIIEIEKTVESVEGLDLKQDVLEENLTSPVKKKKKIIIDGEENHNLVDQTNVRKKKKRKHRDVEDQLSSTPPITEKTTEKTKDQNNEVLDELMTEENYSEMPRREKEKRKIIEIEETMESVEGLDLKQDVLEENLTSPVKKKKKIIIDDEENHILVHQAHVRKKKKRKHRDVEDQLSSTPPITEKTTEKTKDQNNEVLDELMTEENYSEMPRRKKKKRKVIEIEKTVESVEGLDFKQDVLEENLTSPVKNKKQIIIDDEGNHNLVHQAHVRKKKKRKHRDAEGELSGTPPITEKTSEKTKDQNNEVLDELMTEENYSEMPRRKKKIDETVEIEEKGPKKVSWEIQEGASSVKGKIKKKVVGMDVQPEFNGCRKKGNSKVNFFAELSLKKNSDVGGFANFLNK